MTTNTLTFTVVVTTTGKMVEPDDYNDVLKAIGARLYSLREHVGIDEVTVLPHARPGAPAALHEIPLVTRVAEMYARIKALEANSVSEHDAKIIFADRCDEWINANVGGIISDRITDVGMEDKVNAAVFTAVNDIDVNAAVKRLLRDAEISISL